MKQTRTRAHALAQALLAAHAIALAACGAHAPPTDPGSEELEDPNAARTASTETAKDAKSVPSPHGGQIARVDLNGVLDAGPGAFLARAEVKARVVKGQFSGWQVVRSPYAQIDLVPGDVVLAVNGRTLEHPVDLERLWRDLRAANTIAVDVDRGGRRFALRFAVVPPL
jgi:S1-C subfamily serine protease